MSGYSSLTRCASAKPSSSPGMTTSREHQIDASPDASNCNAAAADWARNDAVAELLQQHARDFLHVGIILDQQNRFAPRRRVRLGVGCSLTGRWLRGKYIVTVVPLPSSLLIVTVPPDWRVKP